MNRNKNFKVVFSSYVQFYMYSLLSNEIEDTSNLSVIDKEGKKKKKRRRRRRKRRRRIKRRRRKRKRKRKKEEEENDDVLTLGFAEKKR